MLAKFLALAPSAPVSTGSPRRRLATIGEPLAPWLTAPGERILPRMNNDNRIALVTGANTGIGYHIARQLAEAGLTVLLGSRDEARGRAAVDELAKDNLDLRLLVIDVTSAASIEAAAQQVERAHGRLDVLVNNAGIAGAAVALSQSSLDDIRRTYETNVFGVIAVTNAFLPLLRKGRSPRIVQVSSGMGSLGRMSDRSTHFGQRSGTAGYRSSKAALNALTLLYAMELAPEGIKVNAVAPGLRATNIVPAGMPGAGDPAEGAAIATKMALLPDDGPTGVFMNWDGTVAPW